METIQAFKTSTGRIYESKKKALEAEAKHLLNQLNADVSLTVEDFKIVYDLADRLRELEVILKGAKDAKP